VAAAVATAPLPRRFDPGEQVAAPREAAIRLRDPGLACLSAGLLVVAFPKFDLGALAWVALVPLLVALEGKGPGAAYALSYLTGLLSFFGICYWIWAVPGWNLIDGFLIGVLYLPQYVALWGLGLAWLRRLTGVSPALVAPPLWVTLEYLRSSVPLLAFPWMLLGHSQHAYPSLIQISSVTGAYGLGFLIVLVNTAVAGIVLHLLRRSPAPAARPRRFPLAAPVAAAVLLAMTLLHGQTVLLSAAPAEEATIALVQGNIPQNQKWDRSRRQMILDRYAALTREAARSSPLLIVWPETAVPGDVEHEPELKRAIARVAVETRSHLLVGSAEHAKFSRRDVGDRYYNSLYLFAPDGAIRGQYRKIRLVPFGEYEPLGSVLTWPRAIAAATGKFLAGERYTRFAVGGVPFGAVICWEAIFPDLFREFVRGGARFMIVATNEAWFEKTAAPYQLLAMSAFRAAENGVAIARAANTGVSALIDPFGRVTRRLTGPGGRDLFVEGVLVGGVSPARGPTPYTLYGDVFAYIMVAVTLLVWGGARFRPRRRRASPDEEHGARH